uniref:DUF91 domain-containing protein n=1 Tax=Fervidobacterium pennivorans TaxID=93466 RepID=A0A7V4KBL8_FERPE
MKILIRDVGSKRWKFAEAIIARAESELQKLLVESPSLITIDEIREGASPLVFAVSEFGLPGSGASDVLAFSPQGDIAIIECKLAANPEVKRKVIGQILEYAAYLWGMSYEEVDGRIQKLKGKSLADLVAECVAGEWDEEQFREGVKQTLEAGSFILIIVVDEINEELRRIIRYLNECSKSAFSLHALEMKRFQIDQIEILIPHLYGISTKPTVSKERGQWSEEEFFKVLEEKNTPNIVDLVRDLYDWSVRTADRVWFGTGREVGSFTFHYLKEGKTISVFTIYTNGKLTLNYGWMKTQLPKETLEGFHKKIHEIPSLQQIAADFSKWPSVKVDALIETENRENFKNAVLWLKTQIKLQT